MTDGRVTVELIENPITLDVTEENVIVSVTEQPVEVTIGFSGPQGPKGDKGDNGDVQIEDLSYVHTQNVASSSWSVTHGLGFIPNITVIDSAGSVVEGSYTYSEDGNTVTLSFSSPFSGKAYLS
jgi:hypothetical protein